MAERVIKLFGEPEVTLDGEAVSLGVALPLLTYLILWRGQSAKTGDDLAELLVPRSQSEEPVSSLKKRKKTLRDRLGLELPHSLKPAENGPEICGRHGWMWPFLTGRLTARTAGKCAKPSSCVNAGRCWPPGENRRGLSGNGRHGRKNIKRRSGG